MTERFFALQMANARSKIRVLAASDFVILSFVGELSAGGLGTGLTALRVNLRMLVHVLLRVAAWHAVQLALARARDSSRVVLPLDGRSRHPLNFSSSNVQVKIPRWVRR